MPPRLPYLNAARGIAQGIAQRAPYPGASFSTQNTARSSTTDLLAKIGSDRPAPRSRPAGSFSLGSLSTPKVGNQEESMRRLLDGFKKQLRPDRTPGQPSAETADLLKDNKLGQDLSRQISRRWRAGDVYAPHDLSAVEMAKWKQKLRPEYDVFDMLDLNPMKEYKNFSILSEYVTAMGRIKPRSETGLRPVNQRRIAKAIRRAVGMGLMPSVHLHPEILQKGIQRATQLSPVTKGPM